MGETTSSAFMTGGPSGPVERALREASRVWRRSGVRGGDRRRLLGELRAELEGARADGLALSSVVGDDSRATYRAWAHEREVSGRSLHTVWLVPMGLLAFTLGTMVLATYLITTMAGAYPLPSNFAELGTMIWVTSAVLGVWLPVQAVWAGLASGGDPRARATALWLLVTLPVGQVGAVLLATNASGWIGPRLAEEAVGPTVLAVMAVALLLGRWLAVSRPRPQQPQEANDKGDVRVPVEWSQA